MKKILLFATLFAAIVCATIYSEAIMPDIGTELTIAKHTTQHSAFFELPSLAAPAKATTEEVWVYNEEHCTGWDLTPSVDKYENSDASVYAVNYKHRREMEKQKRIASFNDNRENLASINRIKVGVAQWVIPNSKTCLYGPLVA